MAFIVILVVFSKSKIVQHKHKTLTFTIVENHDSNHSDFNKFLTVEADIDSDFEIEDRQDLVVNFNYNFYFKYNPSESLLSKHITDLFNRVSIPLFILHHSWRSDIS